MRTKTLILIIFMWFIGLIPLNSQNYSSAKDEVAINRYSYTYHTWNHTNLTYRISNSSQHLTTQESENAIAEALSIWSIFTNFTFTKVNTNADITFSWETGDHGDDEPFHYYDHAHTIPYVYNNNQTIMSRAVIHFNEGRNWVYSNSPNSTNNEIDIVHTALHEVGHALGLGESNASHAIMVQGNHKGRKLYADDLQGIWSLYPCPFTINGDNTLCSNGTYTINNLPNYMSVNWSTHNNFNIVSGQGSSFITIQKNKNGYATLYATIKDEIGDDAKTISTNIYIGPPPTTIGTHIQFTDPNNNIGQWSSFGVGNKFSIMTLGNIGDGIYWTEAYLYRLDNYYNPVQQVWHGTQLGRTDISVPSYSPGWYLLKVRGYNDCGYSDWMEQEIEFVDLSTLNFLFDYDSSSEILTITLIEPSFKSTDKIQSKLSTEPYEIQIWNTTSKVRSFKTDLTKNQFSIANLPNGIYIIRITKDGKTYSKKITKH